MFPRFLFYSILLISLMLLAGCIAQATVQATMLPSTGLIGMISRINDLVEHGPSASQLSEVAESDPLDAGDVLRVSNGGEGLLDFGQFLQLRLLNDTELRTIKLEHAANLPLMARIRLETGGFTGKLIEEGGKAVFETPNGAEITILGTEFWIVYDPEEQILGVGNFEGLVFLSVGGDPIAISSNHYVIVRKDQPEPERPMPVTRGEFEESSRVLGSPVTALRTLFLETAPVPTTTLAENPVVTSSVPAAILTATYTPRPPSLTPTKPSPPSLTPTPPPACPPTLEVVQNAFCREGPGSNWEAITSFKVGTVLEPRGLSAYQPLWWYVAIPSGRGSCWISDSTLNAVGEASCLPVVPAPPTYTPIPPTDTPITPSPTPITPSPTPTDTPVPTVPVIEVTVLPVNLPPPAPALISPANGLEHYCPTERSQDTITLQWAEVSDPEGIASYEWVLENLTNGTSVGGAVSGTSVSVPVDCGVPPTQYRWEVRAIDGTGMVGPFSSSWTFISAYILG